MTFYSRLSLILFGFAIAFAVRYIKASKRRQRYRRGRRLSRAKAVKQRGGLRWGNQSIPRHDATQHFLVVGTTGSGKSLVQRLLMKDVLPSILPDSDSRAVVLDAKNDMPAFFNRIGVGCPVFSLNPFEAREAFPIGVSWNVAEDIACSARALNLAGALIPSHGSDNNRYFTDAARLVLASVIDSFIRHSPGKWTFSDLVYAAMSIDRIKAVLNRDIEGRETADSFMGDQRTAYQVYTTICSRMAYFRTVAALWQRKPRSLSLREFVGSESILLLGANSTTKVALDAINEILFRVLVEEVDSMPDCQNRRTWIWIDEARLSGPLLRGDMLPYLAVKGRSKGACLVLSFQDMEGFREAAGARVANEIVAQCSHKALLRMESEESAAWASRLIGQTESLELMHSKPVGIGKGGSFSEQLHKSDTVITSEFYTIPPTSPEHGLAGYFVSPSFGALRDRIAGPVLENVVVPESIERELRFQSAPNAAQRLIPWSAQDYERLAIRNPSPKESAPKGSPQQQRRTPNNQTHQLATRCKKSPLVSRRLGGAQSVKPPKNSSQDVGKIADTPAYLSRNRNGQS